MTNALTSTKLLPALLPSVIALVACGTDASKDPGAPVDAAGADVSSFDGAVNDAAAPDAAVNDAAANDAAVNDGAAYDGAVNDAAPNDTSMTDVGTDAQPGHVAQQVVGTAGGMVTANNGVSIEIPAGALAGDVMITIDEVNGAPLPNGATSLGKTIQLGPEGQTFSSPVMVKLPWSGPDNVPVEIAHASRGGGDWTTLTENAGFDATHVWAETSSFSWVRPVLYQGAPDTPIILDQDNPTGWRRYIPVGSTTASMTLYGTGFRGDTVVTMFKDGVTTATATTVTLTKWGLEFKIPPAFTATLGLLTVEAKNPQATVGDQAAMHVIKTPVLQSLSPSSVDITKRDDGNYDGISVPINVTAVDLLDDLSLCEVDVSQSFGQVAALVARGTALTRTQTGFSTSLTDWSVITGTSDLRLLCRGVTSNLLPFTFKLVE